MLIRSLSGLDLEQAWKRSLAWVRRAVMDVPDRLPFELADRLWDGEPKLNRDHAVQPVQLILATKLSGQTARPFVRVHPHDFLLYQALVDAMWDPIETALGSASEVFAYRLSPSTEDDPLGGSPRLGDYYKAVLAYTDDHPDKYIVQADIASFFISVKTDELERRLLERQARPDVVRDLRSLLSGWHAEGIHGLPQGLLPSSVLGNFYLNPLDSALRSRSTVFWRYMDDMAAVATGFHGGRALLDYMEGVLYEDGLSLGRSKTKVIRATSAGDEFKTMRERFNEGFQDWLGELGDYAPGEDEERELRLDQVKALFDGAVEALRRDEYRRAEFTVALQDLGRASDGYALTALPYVLLRMPGLTKTACSYMADVTDPANRNALIGVLESIVMEERFHRAQEWLHILRAVTVAGDRVAQSLEPKLRELTDGHVNPLVRCRALLAWGRQSDPDDFSVADNFFSRERFDRLSYALVAIQGKSPAERDHRFASWSVDGRELAKIAVSLRGAPLPWNAV